MEPVGRNADNRQPTRADDLVAVLDGMIDVRRGILEIEGRVALVSEALERLMRGYLDDAAAEVRAERDPATPALAREALPHGKTL